MILGAFAYDPVVINSLVMAVNPNWQFSTEFVMRLPVILTLITAVIALITTLGFHDVDLKEGAKTEVDSVKKGQESDALLSPFRKIIAAAKWTTNNRFVLIVILAALILDSVGRQFAVLASEYYRLIDIPVSWFGFIGAGMSLVSIVNAKISRHMIQHYSPFTNFLTLSSVLMIGLLVISG